MANQQPLGPFGPDVAVTHMENSAVPETQATAEQYSKMADGPPGFYDLDVLEDRA